MANSGTLKLIFSCRLEGREAHDIGTFELSVATEAVEVSPPEEAPPEPGPFPLPVQEAIAFAVEGKSVGVFGTNLEHARGFLSEFEDALDESKVGRIIRANGRQAVIFHSGGLIKFHSIHSSSRATAFDRVYVPANTDPGAMAQLVPLMATREGSAIIGYR